MTKSGDQAEGSTRRYAYRIQIRPGSEARYTQAHEDMPDGLKHLYRTVGFRTYALFLAGTDVIAYCETDGDPAVAFRAVADHPLERGFEDSLSDAILAIPTDNGIPARLREVWSLE